MSASKSIVHGVVAGGGTGAPQRVFPTKDMSDAQIGDIFFASAELQHAYALSTGSTSNFGRVENGVHKGVYRDHQMRMERDPEYAAAFCRLLARVDQGAYDQPAIDEQRTAIADPAPTESNGGLPVKSAVHGHPGQLARKGVARRYSASPPLVRPNDSARPALVTTAGAVYLVDPMHADGLPAGEIDGHISPLMSDDDEAPLKGRAAFVTAGGVYVLDKNHSVPADAESLPEIKSGRFTWATPTAAAV